MPYGINLTNSAIELNNITEIEIKLHAFLNNTDNVTVAGWQIYNWTSQSLHTLSDNVFISTTEKNDTCRITKTNLTHFVNQTNNNRIEIFFNLTTTNNTKASINFIEFNVTYPVNKTGIYAEIQMQNKDYGGSWINRTMTHDKVRGIWTFDWVFTPENDSGTWLIYFK